MYSGNETVSVMRKLNSRGYAVLIEELNGGQVVSLIARGQHIKKFRDDMFGNSSDAVPIYGTAMKNMIDWFHKESPKEV